MGEEELKLLVTVVVGAQDDAHARGACQDLLRMIGGTVVESRDCSDEEPGCWSVMIGLRSGVYAMSGDPAGLARAVRVFIRGLGTNTGVPRICCEPPTAWTVLEDPELVGNLVNGGERVLVEAWSGALPPVPGTSNQTAAAPRPKDPGGKASTSLWLMVDVVTERPTAAQWQARALAARITRSATVTGTAEHEGLQRVRIDLGGCAEPPKKAVQAAAERLGRTGWSAVDHDGSVAVLRWVAEPRPASGIAALELTGGPSGERFDGEGPPQAAAWTVPT